MLITCSCKGEVTHTLLHLHKLDRNTWSRKHQPVFYDKKYQKKQTWQTKLNKSDRGKNCVGSLCVAGDAGESHPSVGKEVSLISLGVRQVRVRFLSELGLFWLVLLHTQTHTYLHTLTLTHPLTLTFYQITALLSFIWEYIMLNDLGE